MIAGIEMQEWDDNGDETTGEDEKGPPKYRPVDLTRLLEFYTLSVTGPNLPCLTQEDLAVQAWIRNKKGLLPSFMAKDLVFDEIHDPWLRQFMVLLIKDHSNPEQLRSNYLVKFYVERSVLRADDEYLHCIERPNDGLIGLHLSEKLPNAFRTGFHHYTCGSRRLRYILDGIRFHLPKMSTRKRKCLNGTHVQISIVETEERVTSYIPPNHSIGILDDCVDSVLKAIFLKAACRETGSLPESLCRPQTVRKRDVCFLLPGQSPPRRRGSKARRRRQERRLGMSSSAVQSSQFSNGIPKYDDKASLPQDITSQQEHSTSKDSKPEIIIAEQEQVASKECQSEAITSQQEGDASKESQLETMTSQHEEAASKETRSEVKQPQQKEIESKDLETAQPEVHASPRKHVKKMAVSFDLPEEPCQQRINQEVGRTDSQAKVHLEVTTGGCGLAPFDYKMGGTVQLETKGYKTAHCKRKGGKRVKFQLAEKEFSEVSNSPVCQLSETLKSPGQDSIESKSARLSRGKKLRAFLASLFCCVPRSRRLHKVLASTHAADIHTRCPSPHKTDKSHAKLL